MSRRKEQEVTAEELAARLEADRAADAVRRADELERERAAARHRRRRADLAAAERIADLERARRQADAEAAARLVRLYAEAREAGERTRITAALARSGEARALRLERLRTLNLKVLVPVLLGFAAWSTTGVQAGAARLMQVGAADPMWWVVWLLEPVLIGAVVWIIVARARLAASGGRMAAGAERIAVACLGTSVVLNIVAALPTGDGDPTGWAVVGAIVAHVIGPLGAAATAHLIGLVDRSVAEADPWHDERGRPVPTLEDLDLAPPRITLADEPADDTAEEPDAAAERWVVEQGRVTAEQVAAFLADQDPPAGAVASTPPRPDTDGPVTTSAASRQIDADQAVRPAASHGVADDAERVAPAVAARRQQGEETRRQIADYIAAHPDATPRQIADAVGRSESTVRRHLADLEAGQ